MQTDATLLASVGQLLTHCWPTTPNMLWGPFAQSWKFDRFQTLRNNSQQHAATCNRVSRACKRKQFCWPMLANCWPSTPNILLRPFAHRWKFDRFQTLRNNSQQHVTTCNRVSRACKRTQHVTSNNVGSCWPTVLVKIYIFPTVKLALLLLFYSFNNVVSGVCTGLKIVA